MSLKPSIPALALAVAGVLAGANQADGATVVTPASGDIFVGFRVTGGEGSSTSYLINVGQASQFTATVGTTFTLSNLGDIAADLQAAFGTLETPWYERTDLYWGIFGLEEGVSPTVYGSKSRGGSLTLEPWPNLGQTARNATSSQINSVINGIGGYRGLQATANSPVAGFQQNANQASSYAFQVGISGSTDFGSTSQWVSIEGSVAADENTLDLYRIGLGGVSYRGSFSIDEDGVITYAAIPEPSTAALLLIGGALVGSIRRRQTAHV